MLRSVTARRWLKSGATHAERTLRRGLRRANFDVVRYPSGSSYGHMLEMVIERTGVNCVVDVGAHHGEWAGLVRKAGYDGRLISFEPMPDAFAELEAAAASDDRWTTACLALGDTVEERDMNYVATGLSSLRTPSPDEFYRPWADDVTERREPVRVSRLDHVFDGFYRDLDEPRILLKMDTQGWDLEVFAGATGLLPKIVAVQSEVAVEVAYEGMPRYVESLPVFEDAGFHLAGCFPCHFDGLRLVEFDALFVR